MNDYYRNEKCDSDGVKVDQYYHTSMDQRLYVTYAYHNFCFVLFCAFKENERFHRNSLKIRLRNVKTGRIRYSEGSYEKFVKK